MATTIHLPTQLLESVDRRAAELGMSRNRYIITALENAIAGEAAWSPPFLDALVKAAGDRDGHQALDQMMAAIASERTRKGPPDL